MSTIALSFLARIVVIGLRYHLVAHIEQGIDGISTVVGKCLVVVMQRRLGLYHKVGFIDARIFVVLDIEVWQHSEGAYRSAAQYVFIAHIEFLGMAYVFHQYRESCSSCAAEYRTHKEYAVALIEHIGKCLKFVAVLNLIERHAAYVGRTHKTYSHLVLELIVGKKQRCESLIGLIHSVVADKFAKFALLHCGKIAHGCVGKLYARVAHQFAQQRYLRGKKAGDVGSVAIEFATYEPIVGKQSLGALEVFIRLVRVDDYGHYLEVV